MPVEQKRLLIIDLDKTLIHPWLLFVFLLALLTISCNAKTKNYRTSSCFIRYDSLFKQIDTSKLEIIRNTDSAAIEVLDKKLNDGQRGLFRFDEHGNLRSYAFLFNDHNDASFFLTYDTVGHYYRSTESEVVQWNFYKSKDTIVKFNFHLCAIDRNYGAISIRSGRFNIENIKLFESIYTKLLGANLTINRSEMDKEGKIYITGRWQDKCSKFESDFIDSAIAPLAQINK